MIAYKTIIIPVFANEYMILVPDFPGCFTISYSVEDAVKYATEWIKEEIKCAGSIPEPHDIECNVKGAFSTYIVLLE